MNNKEPKPDNERRYMVGWEEIGDKREIVIVFDRFVQKIVYKVNIRGVTKTDKEGNKVDIPGRKLAYPYIQDFYGIDECVKPRQVRIKIYE